MPDEWVKGSPYTMIAGEVIQFSIIFRGVDSVASPSSTVYLSGSDYSSTAQVSGDSDSVSGNTVTLKKITAISSDAGSSYVVDLAVTIDSVDTRHKKLELKIVSPSST